VDGEKSNGMLHARAERRESRGWLKVWWTPRGGWGGRGTPMIAPSRSFEAESPRLSTQRWKGRGLVSWTLGHHAAARYAKPENPASTGPGTKQLCLGYRGRRGHVSKLDKSKGLSVGRRRPEGGPSERKWIRKEVPLLSKTWDVGAAAGWRPPPGS